LCRVFYEGGKAILDTVTLNPEKGIREFESQVTYVSVVVPADGYIRFEGSGQNDAVLAMNGLDTVLTLLEGTESFMDLWKGKPVSLVNNSFISKEVFLGYLNKLGAEELIPTLLEEFTNSGIEGAVALLSESDMYDDLLEAYKQSLFTWDTAQGVATGVFSGIEEAVMFLNPVAYIAEKGTNTVVAIDVLNDLSSSKADDPNFKIEAIVVPN